MPAYRRVIIPGGSYFLTLNLLERKKTLLTDHANSLRHAITVVKRSRPFQLDALVILPDHLHTIITLPKGDADYATRIRLIKTRFARALPRDERVNAARQRKRERGIWQRRFWEHHIRDDRDYVQHLDYCYFNPVKHGLVERIRDWPHSTFHRDVRAGRYELDWTIADAPALYRNMYDP